MSLFAIGDTHLSLSCDKPMDIFGGWDGYVEKLKENWQNVVKDEDTVVIPGDISWGMSLNSSLKDFEFLHNLKGKKLILKGNHDYWWSTKNKMDKFLLENGLTSIKIIHNNSVFTEGVNICGTRGWIFEKGEAFDQKILARESGRLEASIKDALTNHPEAPIIVFLHYPPIYCNEISEEILDIIIKYNIKECYYGHIHSAGCKYAINGISNGIKLKLVSADFLNFMPYKIK